MPPDRDEASINSAEFVRNFAHYRTQALAGPVIVSHHRRRTHAFLDIAQYEQLLKSAATGNDQFSENAETDLLEFIEWIDAGVFICSSDLTIQHVNRVGVFFAGGQKTELLGQSLKDAFPDFKDSLIEMHVQRSQRGGVLSSADVPSPFNKEQWWRLQTFPFGDKIVLKFRDITEELQTYLLADVKQAILDGMAAHGSIAYARLSMRATIERADSTFEKMIGLPEKRLRSVPIFDLVAREDRVSFREHLEKVFRIGEPLRRVVPFLINSGEVLTLNAGISLINGIRGAEGAIMLMTPTRSEPS